MEFPSMSLPLPVFRLDTPTDLPFEPVCAIAPEDTASAAAAEAGLFSRLQQWLAQPRASLSHNVGGG
jgi:hypothetical protein